MATNKGHIKKTQEKNAENRWDWVDGGMSGFEPWFLDVQRNTKINKCTTEKLEE